MTTPDLDLLVLLEETPSGRPPVALQTPAEFRAWLRNTIRHYEGARFSPPRVARIVDQIIQGENGEIPVRIYAGSSAPTAVIAYFHGGGWLGGDLDTHDKVARLVCASTGATVVSTDYRLAPEHAFPAGFQDCWDALLWASEVDPRVPLLVAGDSAGGTLAACVALRARDEGAPVLGGQVLVYPCIDDDLETTTMREYGGKYSLHRDDLATMFGWYLAAVDARAQPYAMPGFATRLDGLPPTIIATAGFDPLRASAEAYADRLRAAAVDVTLQGHPTLVHGWLDYFPRVPAARRAFDRLLEAVDQLIAQAARGADHAGTTHADTLDASTTTAGSTAQLGVTTTATA